jgi:hypothetical protein
MKIPGVLQRLGLVLLIVSVIAVFFTLFALNFDPPHDGLPTRWWWIWNKGDFSPVGLYVVALGFALAAVFGAVYGTIKLVVWIITGKEIRITKD